MKIIVGMMLAAQLAACTTVNDRVRNVAFGDVKGVATTGNLRLVTERKRPGYPNVVCSEPSPDYLVAQEVRGLVDLKATQSAAQVGAPLLDSAAKAEASKAETASQTNRDKAVLALRDGLYAACQSYANGVLGQDAYAMILSQYGHLLVALVGTAPEGGKAPAPAGQSTASALVVACISAYDHTRVGAAGRSNYLLSPAFCGQVLRRALDRAMKA